MPSVISIPFSISRDMVVVRIKEKRSV